jgi:phosphate transport system permease protein
MMSRPLQRKIANGVFIFATGLATFVALGALALILFSLFQQGFGGLDAAVFTKSTPAPGSVGGLLNAIVGSIMMCVGAMVIAITVGILAGTWLAEIGGRTPFGHVVRFLNDVLLSAPSILVGLFVYELLVRPFHGFSGWAGAAALAMLATPIVVRTTEDVLALQPNGLREAGMALGAPQWVTIKQIIWRSAGPGLLTGGLLGFARISGETAPLLFTALNNQFFSLNMSKPMASLPAVIFQYGLSAYDDWRRLAWAGALLIALAVLVVNILGRVAVSKSRS